MNIRLLLSNGSNHQRRRREEASGLRRADSVFGQSNRPKVAGCRAADNRAQRPAGGCAKGSKTGNEEHGGRYPIVSSSTLLYL